MSSFIAHCTPETPPCVSASPASDAAPVSMQENKDAVVVIDPHQAKLEQMARWRVRCARVAVASKKRIIEIQRSSGICGIPFDEDSLRAMCVKLGQLCTFCGDLPSENEAGVLHRTVASLGYTDTNTVACCAMCNTIKTTKKRPREALENTIKTSPSKKQPSETTLEIASKALILRGRKTKVEFFNTLTGAVVFVAPSIRDAGEMMKMAPATVSARLNRACRAIWVKPCWSGRMRTDAEVDSEEQKQFLDDLQTHRKRAPMTPDDASTQAHSGAAAPETSTKKKEKVEEVEFFNIITGTVVFVAPSSQAAGDMIGLDQKSISARLSCATHIVWVKPCWSGRRLRNKNTEVNPEEHSRFLVDLRAHQEHAALSSDMPGVATKPQGVPSTTAEETLE